MKLATKEFLNEIDNLAASRIAEIRSTADNAVITGVKYYVSNDGDDQNDGLSPESAWKSLKKVTEAELNCGDGVLFRRGDVFRGGINTRDGVTYCAYGEGEKPRIYASERDLADPTLWELYDAEHNIWRLTFPMADCGTLVFNDGEYHSEKLIPSYRNGGFVCRNDVSRPFVLSEQMERDLDLFCECVAIMTEAPSKGENFPIPSVTPDNKGSLFLRCDRGNPGEVFHSIEALVKRRIFNLNDNAGVHIDNLCIKYTGDHAIGGWSKLDDLHVTNCEIGWIGGSIQHYAGTDPNFPQDPRGAVTRYGNGIEVYGGCDDYLVDNCYIYQVYDAGVTHQITTNGKKYEMKRVRYVNNVIENCVYSIEYFIEKTGGDTESYMDDVVISGNILRLSGYGWGQQRHNFYTPAHIKGWSYENTASNYRIENNIFDRAAYRMVHIVAKEESSMPVMKGNTYVQKLGNSLGQFGANAVSEPENAVFDENADKKIAQTFGENDAAVYYLK